MKKFDPSQLNQFIGTEKYYRISRRHLLTDGTKYLAEEAECFWMMDAIASHLARLVLRTGLFRFAFKSGKAEL